MQFIQAFLDRQFWTKFSNFTPLYSSVFRQRCRVPTLSLALLIGGIEEIIESLSFLEQLCWLFFANEPLRKDT